MRGYIYGLFDPRLPLDPHYCRYIGQTISALEKRLGQHVGSARNDKKNHRHVNRWIASLLDVGVRPVIMLFQEATLEMIDHTEREWIANAKWLGWDLTNHQDGGRNNNLIPGVRDRIGASLRGRPLSEETKTKLRIANSGKSPSPEARAKISATLTGRKNGPHSEETRRKIGDSQRGKVIPEDQRKKMSDAGKARFASEDARVEASRLMTAVMSDPEVRWRTGENHRIQAAQALADFMNSITDSTLYPSTRQEVAKQIITDRYGWTCYVCNEPIDPDLTYMDPFTRKVDPGYLTVYFQILPSLGGEETYGNARPGHNTCAKSDLWRQRREAKSAS